MRIGIIYPKIPVGCAWSLAEGLVRTVMAMGHETLDIPVRMEYTDEALKTTMPSLEILKTLDLIIISGTEHLAPSLDGVYGMDAWRKLPCVASWFHESFDRKDVRTFPSVKDWSQHHFFPSYNDAQNYMGTFLPFGVDTTIFKPRDNMEKTVDVGFIGVMYPKRIDYLAKLKPYLGPVSINVDQVLVTQGNEVKALESAMSYAKAICRMKLFFNMPSLSTLHVSKIVEVMACRVGLLTPKVLEPNIFGVNAPMYYDPADFNNTVAKMQITEYMYQTAEEGYQNVMAHHRLDQRVKQILDTVKLHG